MMVIRLCYYLWVTVSTASCIGVKEMTRLYQTLFENYSTEIRPCLDFNQTTEVQIYLSVSSVLELDLKNQILSFIGFFAFTWKDDLLQWNPENFNGIQEVEVSQYRIWRPDIAIYNSVDKVIYLGNENVLAIINNEGIVRWEPAVNIGATCKVDISRFPFDENVCTINVTTWMHDNASIHMSSLPEPILLDQMMSNGQYWVSSAGTYEVYSSYSGKAYETLEFMLKLSRRPNYLVMTFLVPVSLLAALCVVSFLLPPEEPEKVSVAITVLLSFTVFLGVVDNNLPETSDQLCLIVAYVVLLLVLSFLCVAGNAIVVVVYKSETRKFQKSLSALAIVQHSKNLSNDNSSNVSCVVKDKVELPQPKQDPEKEKECNEEKATVEKKYISKAHRLNNYCLVFNTVVLLTLIAVFSILMIH